MKDGMKKAMSEVMKRAWKIRREAARLLNCSVSEVSMGESMKMAWAWLKSLAAAKAVRAAARAARRPASPAPSNLRTELRRVGVRSNSF